MSSWLNYFWRPMSTNGLNTVFGVEGTIKADAATPLGRWHLSDRDVEFGWTCAAVALTLAISALLALLGSASGRTLWCDDFQSQYLPAYTEIGRAFQEGSFPLLSVNSWYGGDLVGEYQYGIFSVVHVSIVLLVLQMHLGLWGTAAALIGIYQAILAAGSFRLARYLGLMVPNAMIAALAATLNGYLLFWGSWNWFNTLSSFAWLPWTWWAMQISLDRLQGCRRFLPAGIALYLLLTAGQPFTDLMAVIVTAWLLAKHWRLPKNRLWPIPAAWAFGLALASPAILALLEYHSFTIRSARWFDICTTWGVPVSAFAGAIIPPIPVSWVGFVGNNVDPFGLRHSTETFCGMAPCVALLAIIICRRMEFVRRYRWELGLLGFVAVLCCFGAAGAFRWPFRWLPLLHLCIGLLGAFALQEWSCPRKTTPSSKATAAPLRCSKFWWHSLVVAAAIGVCIESTRPLRAAMFFVVPAAVLWGLKQFCSDRPLLKQTVSVIAGLSTRLGFWSCIFVSAVIGYVMCSLWPAVTTHFMVVSLLLLGLSGIWLLADLWLPTASLARVWLPVVITALALLIGDFRNWQTMTEWPFGETMCQPAPLSKERTYFALETHSDVRDTTVDVGQIDRFGNTGMYANLSFVNGYSPMHPARFAKILGVEELGRFPNTTKQVLHDYIASDNGLLAQMGVDGLVLGRSLLQYIDSVRNAGWDLVGYFPHGVVFHRPGLPFSRVRSLQKTVSVDEEGKSHTEQVLGRAEVKTVQESRLSVRCRVRNTSENHDAVIAFSRAFYPGYRAYLNGVEVPVSCLTGIQAGVRIPPKAAGELLLVFWPTSVQWGLAIALAASVVVAGVLGADWWFGRTMSRNVSNSRVLNPIS